MLRVATLAVLIACCVTSAPAEDFSAETYLKHVQYLADDAREGRRPGTDGIEHAADYIADQFKKAGLKPAGEDNTWFQSFSVSAIKTLDEEQAGLTSSRGGKWKVKRDFVPFPFSATGDASGPLAFAGYGIEAPDYGYDDYADFDATGKILMIFRHEPKDDDPEAKFGGESPSAYALFVRKARTAAKHGAVGLLIVNPPNRYPDEDTLYEWSSNEARSSYALPMLNITQATANQILKQARMPDVATLQAELDANRESLSTDLKDFSVEIKTGVTPVQTRNVIGVLPGTTRKDEYVLVGGHYDHVGVQRSRRSGGEAQVHNGADDNASGTAGVIELAHKIAAGKRPDRSIIFMTFSAEELGLLGSNHYVENPTVPIESIKAMINFDMIGKLSQDKLTIFGVATGEEFDDMIKRAAEPVSLKYKPDFKTTGIFTRSDHYNFYRKGIPVLFPFTGLHENYHRPGDDWELIDAEGAAKLLTFARTLLVEMANLEDGPTYVDPNARKESEDVVETADAERVQIPRLKVRLGVAPDMSGEGDGMGINAVTPGSAAAKAGMLKGDRIVKIAEKAIASPRDYMSAVADYEPGDEVEITVKRDGTDKVLKVKFAGVEGND